MAAAAKGLRYFAATGGTNFSFINTFFIPLFFIDARLRASIPISR
ncbi:hypothetical protein [Synechococcus lacustris]|nr:hypothetical protein [Synechococcus lacustris]